MLVIHAVAKKEYILDLFETVEDRGELKAI
jgi:hypothetical protein